MAKFHVNSKGEAAPCSATTKACPLGGEHFDSMAEAATAAMEAEFNEQRRDARQLLEIAGSAPDFPMSDEAFAAQLQAQAEARAAEKAAWTPEVREEARNRLRERIERRKAGERQDEYNLAMDELSEDFDLADREGMSQEERVAKYERAVELHSQLDALVAQGVKDERRQRTPEERKNMLREAWVGEETEPAIPQEWQSVLETHKREAVLSVYGNTDAQAMSDYLTRPEVEAMTLDQFKEHLEEVARTSGKNEGRLPIGARGHRYGSTREGKEEAARLQEIASLERKSRVAELLAQNADSKKEAIQHRNEQAQVERQISHLKEQQEIHKARKAHRAGKEIDPQMLEALKRKFMKKFKMPFEESGLSVGDLLQMAQKGEL